MTYRVRYTRTARNDLLRLYGFLLQQEAIEARRARNKIRKGIELLRHFPFTCRKVASDNPFMRELLIPFGGAGYVVLFEIEDRETVTVLAIRHQREDDYH